MSTRERIREMLRRGRPVRVRDGQIYSDNNNTGERVKKHTWGC